MSKLTYYVLMKNTNKPLIWLHGEIKTPPLTAQGRLEAGFLLRQLQAGIKLSLPHSRSMSTIGMGCHELRIQDETKIWRIIYRLDTDAVIILDVFEKKSQATPKNIIDVCRKRIKQYDLL